MNPMGDSDPRPALRLTIANDSNRPMNVFLEPIPYDRELKPGASCTVMYALHREPHLEISLSADGVTFWDASGAPDQWLVFEDEGHH